MELLEHKKRIIIVTDNFLPRRDGVVSFLLEIIPRLKKEFSITIICPDSKEKVSLEGVNFIRIPLSKKKFADFQLAKFKPSKMVKAIKKADVVFAQTIGPIGGSGLFLAQTMKKKTVSFIHSIEWELVHKATDNKFIKRHSRPLAKRVAKFFYKRCNYLIVPSERVSEILNYQGIDTPKRIIHLGVDSERFKPLQDPIARQEERAKLGFEIEDIVIGYHGRLTREKDIYTIIRAYNYLRKVNPHYKLLLVGNGIPEIIEKLLKKEGVVHKPATQHVEKYLQIMDIFVLASLTETTSLSTLEAMSCGLPVITTQVGYVRDYITEGINGLFFPKKNSFVLAKKIMYLANRSSERKILGKQARKTILSKFQWETTAKELESFFKSITEENK